MDMLLHPFEQQSLVKKADVKVAIIANLLTGEKAPETDAVVEVDEYDAIFGGLNELRAVPVMISKPAVA